MKTLDDYMSMSYQMKVVEDKSEGGFVVSYPARSSRVYYLWENNGKSNCECIGRKKVWIETALEEGVEIYESDSFEDYSE